MTQNGLGPLQDRATAVVIGGGPGGTAAAITLRREAQALGRDIRVVIIEEKHFAGERHHNQCVGVLSPPVAELIAHDLGVAFPFHLSQVEITGYVLHTTRRQIVLDGEAEPSIALRRVQFDEYMLAAAEQHGVEVMDGRVTDLEFHADQVIVYTNSFPVQADVVIGAFGMDEGTAMLFSRTVGYRPPPALSAIVTKYHPGDAGMASFGQRIHAFLPPNPHIEFGAITPKANHLTINIAGQAVNVNLMAAFLATPGVRANLPNIEDSGNLHPKDLCFFKGRFPRGLAHNFSGDRFVMVGDAAGLVRAFKGKGVTSAIQTGIRAAQVILREGISQTAFQQYRAANQDIIRDLPFGQAMRLLAILAARTPLMDAVVIASERDAHLRRALFNSVSAHRPYRDVVREAFTPASVQMALSALGELLTGAPK